MPSSARRLPPWCEFRRVDPGIDPYDAVSALRLHSQREESYLKAKGLLLTAVSIGIMFGMVLGLRLYQRYERTAEAQRLYAAGEFEAAKLLYLALQDGQGAAACDAQLQEQHYQDARQMLAAGDYEGAGKLLVTLGDYKDARALLRDYDFQRAGALAAAGKPEEARAVYLMLGDYPGCAEALQALIPALYERAPVLAAGGKLELACTLWQECGDYRDSAKLLKRGQKMLLQQADLTHVKLNDATRRLDNPFYPRAYATKEAYFLFPEEANADTRFFLYFPGGRDEELYTEFLYYYMANPAPNTLAVFLRHNDLPDMTGCCRKALRLLDEAAADCGLFPMQVLAAGSSLGAYPALQFPLIAAGDAALSVPCVLSLDAGNAWNEPELVPTTEQCRELAGLGTHLYLFQPTWEDTDYEPVARLVNAGCFVMLAGCLQDDHEQITYDVFELGVIDCALGDREAPCPGSIYSFRRLRAQET